jgi:hypothetical protein
LLHAAEIAKGTDPHSRALIFMQVPENLLMAICIFYMEVSYSKICI